MATDATATSVRPDDVLAQGMEQTMCYLSSGSPPRGRTQKMMIKIEASFMHDICRSNEKYDQKVGEELKRLENNIDGFKNQNGAASLEERMRKLELGGDNKADHKERATAESPTTGWMPRQFILGGWNNNTERTTIEHQKRKWYNALPRNIQDNYVLGAVRAVEMGRDSEDVHPAGRINEVYWAFARMTEKQDNAIRPPWTAIERSPDEGRRRKKRRTAMEKAMEVLGPGFEFGKSGSVWKGPIDIMKYDGNRETWGRKQGWTTLVPS